MKVIVKGPYKNNYYQPLFILKEEEKLERFKEAIEKKLDGYFQELMTYLNHSLIIKYYPFDVELEIYVNCSISEYEEVKAKFLEFEKNNLDNKVLTKKENFMSENILQRIKHK